MFALDRYSRTLLAAAAFAAFAGAFVTAPFVARGAAGDDVVRAAPATPASTPATFAVVLPRRDPFAGEPPAVHPSNAPMPPLSEIPAAIRPLPPNAGASYSVLPFAAPLRITAVVTGAHPFALVDEGGTTRVVTIGDRIDDVAIIAITTSGVRLVGGATLPVAPAPSTGLPSPSLPVSLSSSPAQPPLPPSPVSQPPIPGGRQP
jgi:hypothetical protein